MKYAAVEAALLEAHKLVFDPRSLMYAIFVEDYFAFVGSVDRLAPQGELMACGYSPCWCEYVEIAVAVVEFGTFDGVVAFGESVVDYHGLCQG